jgi:hypothetical protein
MCENLCDAPHRTVCTSVRGRAPLELLFRHTRHDGKETLASRLKVTAQQVNVV